MATAALKAGNRPAEDEPSLLHPGLGIPTITADLRPRIGSSQIDQFVLDHGAADVLRELVQNEFDGGGAEMAIHFGADMLTVTGSGQPITTKGWTRLNVIMGTGEVIGEGGGERIDPKQNGIGSKNFGLRSVFYFADRIHVRSNSQMAILDIRELVVGQQPDPGSSGRKGVLIQAPYRTELLRQLPAFTPDREASAFEEIGRALFPTLVKLALDGRRTGLRRLTVASERLGKQLTWRQSVKTLKCATPRVTAQQRVGRLTLSESVGGPQHEKHEEIEFSRYVEIPPEYVELDFPAYYRLGRRVKVAVSLPLRRGQILHGRAGRFYYPLEAGQARTGCTVSVSGPFQLNADRSRLIETPWNNWLRGQAADLVADLVGSDWLDRFGPAGYEALAQIGPDDEPGSFQALVVERLRTTACWPTAAGRDLRRASSLVVADDPVLVGQLEAEHYLDPRLASSPIAAPLARACGAKRFSLNSLVRLRCAGEDASRLATKLAPTEANFRHNSFPGALLELEVQIRAAQALAQLQKRISPPNWRDLGETDTTLTATGALRAARDLVVVQSEMWDGCPVPLENRLHPALIPYRAITALCQPFDLRLWIKGAATRAAEGTISETERLALYRHLIAPDTALAPALLALVRRSPVLQTDSGEWAAAEDLAWLPQKEQTLFAPVLKAPAREVRTKALLQRFRIRGKLVGRDLGAMGDVLATRPELSGDFEALLARNMQLLTPRITNELAQKPILRSRSGDLTAPVDLHLPTPVNRACLDNPADIVAGNSLPLYRRLGCSETPGSVPLLQVIADRRARKEAPPHPDQFYPALVEALRTERVSAAGLLNREILYVEGAYVTPRMCLVSSRAPNCLRAAVPIFRSGGEVAASYIALGADVLPREQHWTAFFEWVDARACETPGQPLSKLERVFLREAYRRPGMRLPDVLLDSTRCLLGSSGEAFSLADLRAGRFLENDYPELADSMIAAGAGIAFADEDEASRGFFRALGLKALSQVCGEPRVAVGAPASAPSWFRVEKALGLLHGQDLPHAVAELAAAHQKQVSDFVPVRSAELKRRLAAIQRITFVREVQRIYSIGKRVSVAAEAAVVDDALAVRPPGRRWEFDHLLAAELAQLAGAKRLPDIRSLVSAILPLIQAESGVERLAYLQRLGIRPQRWPTAQSDEAAREEELQDIRQDLMRDLVETLQVRAPSAPALPPAASVPPPPVKAPPAPAAPAAPPPLVLPPAEKVVLAVSGPMGTAPPTSTASSGSPGAWRPGPWSPRTPAEQARDATVGRHGEEIVYRLELARLRAFGVADPEQRVIWSSQLDPGADHDIRSVGEDGQPIWIEVKTTTGSDGRFDWPRREFEKALREGARYQLWRVYEAASPHPTAKVFVDPVGLIRNSVLRLEIGDLRAFVEAK